MARRLPVRGRSTSPCSPEGMGAVQMRVQPDAGNPARDESRILSRAHTEFRARVGLEKKFAEFLPAHLDVAVHRLAGLFRQFKSDGPPGLFLAHGRAIDRIAIRSYVFDPDSDDITASQLAVDRQIEHRQIAGSLLDLELGLNRPDMFLTVRWLGSYQFSLIPGCPLGCR